MSLNGLPASLTITGAGEIPDSHRWDSSLKIRFARDSPLERGGFELPVPLAKRVGLSGGTGGAAEAERVVPRAPFILRGDRGFESSSLQQRVCLSAASTFESPDE